MKPFEWAAFNAALISKLPIGDMIAAIDGSAFAKAGRKTYGKGHFWSGSIGKMIAGIEISCIALIDLGCKTAFSLYVRQTDGQLADEASRIDFYIQQFLSVVDYLKVYTRFLVADGFYAKFKFVDAVVKAGMQFIGKLRQDANLMWLYEGEPRKGRGRPKKYDGKVSFSSLERFTYVTTLDDLNIYEAMVWSVALKRKIKVVILKSISTQSYAILFTTDMGLSAVEVMQYYKARFQIEFLFRDAKQHMGLTDCQSVHQQALDFHFNASMSAVNLAKYEILKSNSFKEDTVISIDNYKRIKANTYKLERIFSILNLDPEIIKNNPEIHKFIYFGCFNHSTYT